MVKSLTDLDGVFGAGFHAGIKRKGLDLGYLYIPNCCASAGVFTRNRFSASSVTYTQKLVKRHVLKALIVNAGNANAVTGKEGAQHTRRMGMALAKTLGIPATEVAVASTGIIGVRLPVEKIEEGMFVIAENPNRKDGESLAEAIMTTDLYVKHAVHTAKIGKYEIVVAGIAKGSGMIAPNMATMLSFFVTNARLSSEELQLAFSEAVDDTFNMMSVDTDTSTNDMALCFATGQHAVHRHSKEEWTAFVNLVREACQDLTVQIARDGEGAQKVLEVRVAKAARRADARAVALSIVNSPLVKTAVHGADPNWGRVVMAIGKTPGVKLNPEKVDVYFGPHLIVQAGEPVAFDREAVVRYLSQPLVGIDVNLNLGASSATAWGCDLTKGYIDINTKYN